MMDLFPFHSLDLSTKLTHQWLWFVDLKPEVRRWRENECWRIYYLPILACLYKPIYLSLALIMKLISGCGAWNLNQKCSIIGLWHWEWVLT